MKAMFVLLCFLSYTASAALPKVSPDVSVVVTSCHEVVTVIMVMPDGSKLLFDQSSGEDVEELKKLAEGSKSVSVYEVGCFQIEQIPV
jgi:hypothetical protein